MLWTAHPLNTSAVTYVIHRFESLAALFYFAAVVAFLEATRTKRRAWLAPLAILLGSLSKETVVTAPVLLFILDASLVSGGARAAWRAHRRSHLAHCAALIPLAVLVATATKTASQHAVSGLAQRLAFALTLPGTFGHYLELVVWPRVLTNDYYDWPLGLRFGTSVVVFLCAAVGLGALAARRHHATLVGVAFFIVMLPVSNLAIPLLGEVFAERRMYIPLAAITLAVGALAETAIAFLSRRVSPRLALLAGSSCIGLVVMALTVRTVVRNADYMSDVALYAQDVEARPNNPRAHTWLASALMLAGHIDEGATHAERAFELDPNMPRIATVLTRARSEQGRYDEAALWATRSLRTGAHDDVVVHTAALALVRVGQHEAAIRALESRARDASTGGPVLDLLGWLLATEPSVRDGKRALEYARRALVRLGPSTPPHFRETLPAALAAAGEWDNAVHEAERAAREVRAQGDHERADRLTRQANVYRTHEPWDRDHETRTRPGVLAP